jgi:AraC family transcriptional regulator of adaptative response / DNA-3-methyladenine glycosylase II
VLAVSIRVGLRYREPCDVEGLLAFLGARAIPGIEAFVDGVYHRSLRLPRAEGVVALEPGQGEVRATLWLADAADLEAAVAHCRCLLDLDADPRAILEVLGADPLIGAAVPGRRVPGHVDPFELAVRAVLGQQISVAGAATLAGRLVARYGEPLAAPRGQITHVFPTAAALASARVDELPMPRARGRALVGLAGAIEQGRVALSGSVAVDDARRALLGLPGIGPWTADYIAMRALGDRDVFLPTDLGVKRALRRLGRDDRAAAATALAERWRPYRAYAMLALWSLS